MGNLHIQVNPIDETSDNTSHTQTHTHKQLDGILKTSSTKKFALGIIDPQNDFFKKGSLAVSEADEILGPINKLRYICKNILTFVSQDYHPSNHMSFAETHGQKISTKKQLTLTMENNDIVVVEQDMWPTHCVGGTPGSEFHKNIIINPTDKIVKKGTKANVESYSAFGDENNAIYENTGLDAWLKSFGTTDIVLVGVATDYCVYNTALDSVKLGYNTHLILSCTRGVTSETTKKALADLKEKKVQIYSEVDDFYKLNQTHLI